MTAQAIGLTWAFSKRRQRQTATLGAGSQSDWMALDGNDFANLSSRLHSHTAAPSTMILLAKAYPSRNLPDLDQHPPINAPPHSGRPLHPLPQVTHSSCNTHSFSASLDLPLLPCLVVSHFTGARYPTHNDRPPGLALWPPHQKLFADASASLHSAMSRESIEGHPEHETNALKMGRSQPGLGKFRHCDG